MRKQADYIFFWTSGHAKYGFLSTWYPSPFQDTILIDGNHEQITFPTVEHWMAIQKALLFNDKTRVKRLLKIRGSSPDELRAVRQLANNVANVNKRVWADKRERIAYEGNYQKFRDYNFHEQLMSTGDKVLVKASPRDDVWGIGSDEAHALQSKWGRNLLGKVLDDVRTALRKDGYWWPDEFCWG